jgi:hypothetical protein
MYTPINELNQVNSKNQSKITSKSQIFNPLVSNKYLQSKLGKLQLNKSRYNPEFRIPQHANIKPPKHFFGHVKNQYYVEGKVDETHIYHPITSFEQKLNNEMKRISNRYGKVESRQIFYPNINTDFYWRSIPNFEMYRQLKVIENRYSGLRNKMRPRLKPIGYVSNDNLNKLAQHIFENDPNVKKAKNQLLNLISSSRKNKYTNTSVEDFD